MRRWRGGAGPLGLVGDEHHRARGSARPGLGAAPKDRPVEGAWCLGRQRPRGSWECDRSLGQRRQPTSPPGAPARRRVFREGRARRFLGPRVRGLYCFFFFLRAGRGFRARGAARGGKALRRAGGPSGGPRPAATSWSPRPPQGGWGYGVLQGPASPGAQRGRTARGFVLEVEGGPAATLARCSPGLRSWVPLGSSATALPEPGLHASYRRRRLDPGADEDHARWGERGEGGSVLRILHRPNPGRLPG